MTNEQSDDLKGYSILASIVMLFILFIGAGAFGAIRLYEAISTPSVSCSSSK